MSIKLLALLAILLAGCERETAKTAAPQFLHAIEAGNTDVATNLLHKFPELARSVDEYGVPVLDLAINADNFQLASALLNLGADPNGAGKNFPILTAMAAGPKPGMVKLLIQHGVNVNVADSLGVTPLMKAADYGDIDTARLLVDKGVDVNAKDIAAGKSVLHHAVYGGNVAIVSLLVEHHADRSATDHDGLTALQMAQAEEKPILERDEIMPPTATAPDSPWNKPANQALKNVAGQPKGPRDLKGVIEALGKS